MDQSKNQPANPARDSSSREILSPGGKSRYGRTRRPKISQDFYDIDSVIIDENPVSRQPAIKSPKLKSPPKGAVIGREIIFEIKDEFTKLDDLGMKVANNFKTNLQRGLDDSIKERKFFKSMNENKVEVPNVVDVTKVLKLISTKPTVISDVYEKKTPSKTTLKTYSNKRKHLHEGDSCVVESFGLPDEPIIPVNSPFSLERDHQIDVDVNLENDVNLQNPWSFDEFQSVPISITTMEEFNGSCFNRNSVLDLFSYDSLMSENSEIENSVCLENQLESLPQIKEKAQLDTAKPVNKKSEAIKTAVEKSKQAKKQKNALKVVDNIKSVETVNPEPKKRVREARNVVKNTELVKNKEVITVQDKKINKAPVKKLAENVECNIVDITSPEIKTSKKKSAKVDSVQSAVDNKNETVDEIKKKTVHKKTKPKPKLSQQTENRRILRSNIVDNVETIKETPLEKEPQSKDDSTVSLMDAETVPEDNSSINTSVTLEDISEKQDDSSANNNRSLRSKSSITVPEENSSINTSITLKDISEKQDDSSANNNRSLRSKSSVTVSEENSSINKSVTLEDVSEKQNDFSANNNRSLRSKSSVTVPEENSSINTSITLKDVSEKQDDSSANNDRSLRSKSSVEQPSPELPAVVKLNTQVINPVNLSKIICKSQVRVILNPLACIKKLPPKFNEDKNLVPNPFKLKKTKLKVSAKQKRKLRSSSKIVFNSVSDSVVKVKNNILKKKVKKQHAEEVEIKEEPVDVKNIKTEIIEYNVGDLTWAKIGTHPYWPCMITEEPFSGVHKKMIPNRSQPLYHVRFFGDKGRRSWVSSQRIMLYCSKDDLDNLAKALKAEDKVKLSFIKESYIVKPAKLAKWQSGVDEAECLKTKSVEERLNYFFETFASKREKKQKMLEEYAVKQEALDEIPELEKQLSKNSRKRARQSEGDNQEKTKVKKTKHVKPSNEDALQEEIKIEIKPEDQAPEPPKKAREDAPQEKKGKKEEKPSEPLKKAKEDAPLPEKKGKKEEKPPEPLKKAKEDAPLQEKKGKKEEKPPESPKKLVKKPEIAEKSQIKPPNQQPSSPKKPAKKEDEDSRKKPSKKGEETEDQETRKRILRNSQQSEDCEPKRRLRNSSQTEEEKKPKPPEPVVEKKPVEAQPEPEEPEEYSPPKLRNKRHAIPCEYSNSDTDSKVSDNSSVPSSLEAQAALYRRNNIFRGIPKEKVCQICEKPGDVFKCKGPCNGVYHYNCAMSNQAKEDVEEKKVEKQDAEADNKSNVEIISVNSKKPLPNLSASPNIKGMTLAEKIDFRMKEIMKKFDYQSVYSESTDSSSEEFILDESFEKNESRNNKLKSQSKLSLTVTSKPSNKEVPIIKHVTADNINYICVTNEKPKDKVVTELIKDTLKHLRCTWCSSGEIAPCLVCHKEESKLGSKFRQKCSLHQCGKYYHPECLKVWPQTQWSLIQSTKDKKSDATYDTFVCPRHVCHTCISDDPRAANSRCPSDKVVKCLRCPATYHSSNYCVPAGTQILSSSQIVCPRHYSRISKKRNFQQTINTNWCFICSKGGDLICCETCPTSVHVECLPGGQNADDTFFCEDCQSGRLPLYDEIVWVKLGTFRWWPALILFPNEVPDNVRNIAHNKGEFVVKFFGTYDHYWVGRGRTFLFQEGDKGHSHSARKRVDNAFVKAIEEAAIAHQLKKQFKGSKMAEKNNTALKPPPYIRIKVNKPVGNVRQFDGNTSNTTSCDCDPNQPHPCGPDSDCLNRLLLTECNPEVCPAGERCNNQCFEKREYPPLVPHHTQVRGWGLKTLAPIRKGQFVIEYVGEMIDEQEYQRRVQKMHEQKEENYYFLTIDKDRMLDAGPKGNVARFMNHSCQPNCETQKWTVNGDTRVGLFAKCDIPAGTELTFNYNLECIGKEKKICKCGAPNCSGFIGVKVKPEGAAKKSSNKPKKKKSPPPPPPEPAVKDNPCFCCGKTGNVGACNNKMCTKFYHLECVAMNAWPEGGKWVCQWHNCNFCSKRTIRCCVKCVNSYCPPHSEGNIRYDKTLGFVCTDHDPTKESNEVARSEDNANSDKGVVEKAEEGSKKGEDDDFLDSLSLEERLNGCVTSTPLKKDNNNSDEKCSQNEEENFSSETKKVMKNKKKKSGKKVEVNKVQIRNTANLQYNPIQNEVKLSNFTPVKYLRNRKSSSITSLNRTDPDKDLPIRKRTRLRCGNTL